MKEIKVDVDYDNKVKINCDTDEIPVDIAERIANEVADHLIKSIPKEVKSNLFLYKLSIGLLLLSNAYFVLKLCGVIKW